MKQPKARPSKDANVGHRWWELSPPRGILNPWELAWLKALELAAPLQLGGTSTSFLVALAATQFRETFA
jgi:hypothetical protein